MKLRQISKAFLALSPLLFLTHPLPAAGEITNPQVVESNGKPMFSIYYLGEAPSPLNNFGTYYFSWTYEPNKLIQSGVNYAVQYWADILGKYSVNTSSIPLYISTIEGASAACFSAANNEILKSLNEGEGNFLDYESLLGYLRTNASTPWLDSEMFTSVIIGKKYGAIDPQHPENFGWTVKPDSLICNNETQSDLAIALRHELAHGLGICTDSKDIYVILEDELIFWEEANSLLGIDSLGSLPELEVKITNSPQYDVDCTSYIDHKGEYVHAVLKVQSEEDPNDYKRLTDAVFYISENLDVSSYESAMKGLFSPTILSLSGRKRSAFGSHLYDINGTQAKDGMLVVPPELYNKLKAKLGENFNPEMYFVMTAQSTDHLYGAYFTGDNVREVLNGAELEYAYDESTGKSWKACGVPINGWETTDITSTGHIFIQSPELSHINLTGGMMSHAVYYNVTNFLEAELAVLQDIGYQINRKDYYGWSEYRDSQTYANYNGYYALNEQGTDWIVGKPNETNLGIGLDIYGSSNTITQMADLLTVGRGSAGIRINGTRNTVTVARDVFVQSDGYNGTGVLVSSGSGHNLTIDGTVTSEGDKGKALVFDYGSNFTGFGNYFGSYISYYRYIVDGRITSPYNQYITSKYNGPLMDKVSITGTVRGNENAIYISKNAFVKEIELAGNACLIGDITSEWKEGFGDVTDTNNNYYQLNLQYKGEYCLPSDYIPGLVTTLSFAGDNVLYAGTITAATNSRIKVSGGKAALLKDKTEAKVSTLSVEVAEGSVLTSNQDYTLTPKNSLTPYRAYEEEFNQDTSIGTFTNAGTLVIGDATGGVDAMRITGNYRQKENAVLSMHVGRNIDSHSSLSVMRSAEGSESGTAFLAGTLSLSPVKTDYFETGTDYTYTLGDFVNAEQFSESIRVEAAADSAALSMKLTTKDAAGESIEALSNATDVITVSFERDYAQHATDDNGTSLAKALQGTNPYTGSAMENLYVAIDLSRDGAAVSRALNSLKPSIYGDIVQSIFTSQKQNLSFRQDSLMKSSLLKDGVYSHVEPYVMHESRKNGSHGYRVNDFGLIAEMNTVGEGNVYGAYAVLNKKDFKAKDKKAKATDYSLYAGADALVRPCGNPFFLTADLGLGFESLSVKRNTTFNGYKAAAEKRYTAYGFYGSVGAGFDVGNSSLTLTPFAKLNYTMLYQRALREDGKEGMELKLDSKTFKSLSSSVGLKAESTSLTAGGSALSVAGSVAWKYELTEDYGNIRGTFREASKSSFNYKVKPYERSSFEAMGSLKISKGNFSFSTDVGVENYQGSGNDFFARLSFLYSF